MSESNGLTSRCRALSGFAQHLRGDEVHEALAPTGLLNDEQTPGAGHDVFDGFRLVGPELRARVSNAGAQQRESTVSIKRRHWESY